MTDSRMALGMDRLPWLPDEPPSPPLAVASHKPVKTGSGLLGWAFAAILLVAIISYWLGTRTDQQVTAPSATSVPLPPPSQSQTNEPVQPLASPDVRPLPEPEVRRIERETTVTRPAWRPLPREVPREVAERVHRTIATEEADRVSSAQTGIPPKAAPVIPAVPNTQSIRLWPARESGGAYGRVVQIGAFGSRQQAKLGWRYMSRAYPGVRRLPAVVVEARNSRGRPFYRFQIGTTSQAHSEILCQRMERIRFSCAVVGLPGEKRAVER